MGLKFHGGDLLALAFSKVAAEHSDRPIYFVLPSRRSLSRAPMDSSSGVSEICLLVQMLSRIMVCGKPRLTWVYAVEIVEVGSEAEPLNGTLNVLIDMGRRVGDSAGGAKDIESTLGCNWATCQFLFPVSMKGVANTHQRPCHGRCAS